MRWDDCKTFAPSTTLGRSYIVRTNNILFSLRDRRFQNFTLCEVIERTI